MENGNISLNSAVLAKYKVADATVVTSLKESKIFGTIMTLFRFRIRHPTVFVLIHLCLFLMLQCFQNFRK